MASQFQPNSTLRYRQLAVEQQNREECEEMQEIMDDFMLMNRDVSNLLKDAQGLKINEARLLRYAPYLASQDKSQQSTVKPELGEKLNQTQLLRINSRQIIKNPHLIKHKVTPRGIRLKTQADKENIDQSFLPKMTSKNKNKQNILNKTTSAISLRAGFASNSEFRQGPSTALGTKVRDFNSEQELNSSQRQSSCLKNSSRYGSNLKQTLKRAPSSSKFKVAGNQGHSQVSCQPTSIMTALTQITSKQDALLQDKRQLQSRVKQLKQEIQREHWRLEEIKKNQQKLGYEMSRQSYQQRHSLDEAKVSKKKNQNYLNQAKALESKVGEVLQANTKVLENIEEEKQLIIMYECVIEEVRGQLKLEKQAKQDLQKKLTIMKKSMKSLEIRVTSQEASNRELVRKIYSSLQKWR